MQKKHSAKARLFFGTILTLAVAALCIGLPAVGQPEKGGKDGPALVQTLKGHKDAVFALAFTPDGKFVITGSFDKTLKMWDPATGQEVRTFGGAQGHTNMVNCAAISKDGQFLASGSVDNTLKIWDVPSSSPLKEFVAKEAVNAVALTPDGKKLATALTDGTVKIWNAEDGKELLTLKGHAGPVKSVAFSANGATLASCDDKGMVRFWTVADGKAAGEIGAHAGPVNGVTINPNNVTAYSIGQDGTLRFWAVATPLPRPFPAHAQPIITTAYSADGAQVLSASTDKVAKVSTFANGQQLRLLDAVPAPVTSASFNSNATQIAGGTQDGQFIVWNNADGKILAQAQGHEGAITGVSIKPQNDQAITAGADGLLKVWALPLPAAKSLVHPDEVLAAAWKADGTKVYTGGKDKIVRSWLMATGALEKPFAGHTAAVTAVALNPAGTVLASGGEDTTIRLWNPVDGKETAQIGAHGAKVTSLVFNAAGTQLLSASADGTVKLWQVPPPPTKSLAHPDQVTTLVLTPDGTKLITGGNDKIVRVWNLATAAKEKDLPGLTMPISAVAVSGNGQFAAGGSAEKAFTVWKLADGKEVKKIPTPAAVTALALDADAKVAAVGQADNSIQLVNPVDGKEIKKLAGHTGPLTGLIYTAKGDQIISASADKTVKIWNVADGMAKTTLEHVGPVTCVALSKDGMYVAAGSAKSIKVWKLADGKEATGITTKGDVKSLSFSPKGEIVVTGEADNTTRVYGLDGKLQQFFTHPAAVNAVAFHNDGKQIITAGADKQVQVFTSPLLWQQTGGPTGQALFNNKTNQVIAAEDKNIKVYNATDGKEVKAFPANEKGILSLAITGDASKLVTLGANNDIATWNLTTLDKDKEIKPLAAHAFKGTPQGFSLSPDGNRVAVAIASDKGTVIDVIDTATGKMGIQSFADHKGAVTALAFHTDNKTILTAGADKTARILGVGVVAIINAHPGGASMVQYHSNGTQAISAGADKTVKLWDLTKNTVAKTFGPVEEAVHQAAFSKEFTQIGAASGKSVRIFNVADGKELAKLDHPAKATSVSFNTDKTRIVTGCEDKQARIWDVATKKVQEFFIQEEPASSVYFHNANTSVVVGSGKTVTVGTMAIQKLVVASDQPLLAVATIPAATHVLTGGADKSAKMWNVTTGVADKTFAGATGSVQAVAVAPNGILVAVGGADKTVRTYTLADAKEVKTEPAPGEIYSLRFSPNSQVLIGTCAKNTVMAWDVLFTAGQPLPDGYLKTVQLFQHGDQATDVVMAPDNATIYSGSLDKTAKSWRLAAPTPKINLPHPGNVMAVAFSPDGKLFASAASDGKVRVYDMDKKTLVKEITAHATKDQTQVYALAFSADSQMLASAGIDKDVKIWNPVSGALVKEIKKYKAKDAEDGHKDTVNAVAFSPDGKTLATGSAGLERVIKLWNVADGKLIKALDNPKIDKGKFRKDPQSHPGWIYGLNFTKDGKFVVSSGNAPKNKGYLGIWKVADGTLAFGQELPLGVFYGFALSPDQSIVAVGAGYLGKAAPQFNCAYLLKMPPLQ